MFVQLCKRCGVVIAYCDKASGAQGLQHTECTDAADVEYREMHAAHVASLATDTPLPEPVMPTTASLAETRTVKQSNEAALVARVAGRAGAPVTLGAIADLLES